MKRATAYDVQGIGKAIISIHALVKRATEMHTIISSVYGISIHALVKRATLSTCSSAIILSISIHALVKRATVYAV